MDEQRRDDTPKTPPASPSNEPKNERERDADSYYYDDGTGYEIYDSTSDEDEESSMNESSETP